MWMFCNGETRKFLVPEFTNKLLAGKVLLKVCVAYGMVVSSFFSQGVKIVKDRKSGLRVGRFGFIGQVIRRRPLYSQLLFELN